MDIDTVGHITDAILESHHCDAQYLRSVRIRYTYKNRVLWKGRVGIFRLAGHGTATLCYAWLKDELLGMTEPILVLESEEIDSPRAAIHWHLTENAQQLQHN